MTNLDESRTITAPSRHHLQVLIITVKVGALQCKHRLGNNDSSRNAARLVCVASPGRWLRINSRASLDAASSSHSPLGVKDAFQHQIRAIQFVDVNVVQHNGFLEEMTFVHAWCVFESRRGHTPKA